MVRLRVHYLDEGPPGAAPVLLLPGEPSWSFLYRHMIAPLAAAGDRVIVPDQIGFGRSDKPTEKSDYTYARHVQWMSSLVFDELDLTDTTFFGQDWGGLIGLRLVAAAPARSHTSPDDPEAAANRAAWKQLEKFEKPFLCCFSDRDAVTNGGDKPYRDRVPGAQDQQHVTIDGAGHFLQEDSGVELAKVLNTFIGASR